MNCYVKVLIPVLMWKATRKIFLICVEGVTFLRTFLLSMTKFTAKVPDEIILVSTSFQVLCRLKWMDVLLEHPLLATTSLGNRLSQHLIWKHLNSLPLWKFGFACAPNMPMLHRVEGVTLFPQRELLAVWGQILAVWQWLLYLCHLWFCTEVTQAVKVQLKNQEQVPGC